MKRILPILTSITLMLSACTLTPSPSPIPTYTATTTDVPQPTITPLPTSTLFTADICVLGDWELSNEDASKLLAFISSTPSMIVREGVLRIRFDDNNFVYHSDDLVVRSSVESGYLDADATVLIEGSYTPEGDQLLFIQTVSETELYNFRVVDENGEEHPFFTTDSLDFQIPESAVFSCIDDELTLTFSISGFFNFILMLSRVK
jgi:hypothetical protein